MSDSLSRRGILLAAGGATAALVATGAPQALGQAPRSRELPLGVVEGDLSTEEFDAAFAHTLICGVQNDSRVPKRRIHLRVKEADGTRLAIQFGDLGAAQPPDPGPAIARQLIGVTAVEYQFWWKERGVRWIKYPVPDPEPATAGMYFTFLFLVWDENNLPNVSLLEDTL